MKRTDNKNNKSKERPVILSKYLMDRFLEEQNAGDIIALYCFYYYTAQWQKTNQPKINNIYTLNGLHWSKERLQKAKKILRELNLIESIHIRDKESNYIIGHYIKVNYLKPKSQEADLPTSGGLIHIENPTELISIPLGNRHRAVLPPGSKKTPNSLKSNRIKALNTNSLCSFYPKNKLITPKMFERFYILYPRKGSEGKAKIKWDVLCRQKNKRPTWGVIRTAIIEQKKSDQWQNKKFIAVASTWINQKRWLDDPKEMKDYTREKERTNKTGKRTIAENHKFRKDGKL